MGQIKSLILTNILSHGSKTLNHENQKSESNKVTYYISVTLLPDGC